MQVEPSFSNFSKLRKFANWQLATDTLIVIIKAQRQIFDGGFETPFIPMQHTKIIVLINNLNICTNYNFGMSHIILVLHSSNPSWEILSLGLDDCN